LRKQFSIEQNNFTVFLSYLPPTKNQIWSIHLWPVTYLTMHTITI